LRSGEKLQAIAPVVSQAAEEEAQSGEATEAKSVEPPKPTAKPTKPKKS